MSGILTEVLVIVLLLILNGVFAMSELAIVTARKVRLEQRADDGDAGARAALALAHEPTQFLSTVQVGITLIGVLAGAFGGATIAEQLAVAFANVPLIAPYANGVALGVVVTAITYLSLVVGELVPKRVALSNPERIAALVARPMRILARIASPVVILLTGPTNLVLRVFGIRVSAEPSITVEEIRALIEQGAESGVLEGGEHQIVESVFRFGDRLVTDVMTPRTFLDCLDVNDAAEHWKSQVVKRPSSRYFVCDGTIDNILGVVFAEDLLAQVAAGEALDLRRALREPLYVPGTLPALSLLEQMRTSHRHIAVALDEYGGVEGAILLDSLIDAVVGEPPSAGMSSTDLATDSDNRTLVLPGSTLLEDVETDADLPEIPDDVRRGVRTLGGLIMNLLEHVPREGESVEWKGIHFEVAKMQGRSVSRVIIRKAPARSVSDRRLDPPV
jgi:putative hemolysin